MDESKKRFSNNQEVRSEDNRQPRSVQNDQPGYGNKNWRDQTALLHDLKGMAITIPSSIFSTLFVNLLKVKAISPIMRRKNTKLRKGRSALPSKTTQTTITRLYPLFLMLLPIIFSVIVFFGYSQTKLLYYQNEVQAMDRQLNSVFQILSLFDKRVKDNSITRTEAQESAKKLLAGTRLPDGTRNTNDVELTLSSGDAFIVFNSQGNLLVHPHLEGQNMFQLSDADGRTLVREVLHKGKTVITYPSLDPTTETRDTKIAVARYFPEWDWHVSLTTAESDFYHQLSLLKSLLVLLVLGSYLITAFLFITRSGRTRRCSAPLCAANSSRRPIKAF